MMGAGGLESDELRAQHDCGAHGTKDERPCASPSELIAAGVASVRGRPASVASHTELKKKKKEPVF
jgi:hypothetical protein